MNKDYAQVAIYAALGTVVAFASPTNKVLGALFAGWMAFCVIYNGLRIIREELERKESPHHEQ